MRKCYTCKNTQFRWCPTFRQGVWKRKCYSFVTMEKNEKKMADFQNHRRFLLRCLKYDVIPVSLILKTNVRTTEVLEIIRKAEKQLLNECIRSINNQLELYMYEKEACFHQLEEKLDNNIMEEYQEFINRVVEARHQRVLDGQRSKFEALY